MICLKQSDYEKMLRHAERELPDEACGLIAGVMNGEDREIREVYLLTNTDHSDKHFSLAPKEQFAAIRDMRTKGLVLLGSWHSHPATPSRPSAEDQRLAFDSKASYLILSLMERDRPVLRAFRITGNDPKTVEQEELVIRQDDSPVSL